MARDSPMTISIELARGTHGITAPVSHECIYQAIYAHGTRGLRSGLHHGLHRRRRCRKRRLRPGEAPTKTSPLGLFTPIAARPEVASGRSEVGHLEGDLICGAFNRSAIVTLFDRASRKVFLAGFDGAHDADATLEALQGILGRIPAGLRASLTWDQGREIARHRALTKSHGIAVYIADPHAP
jgi:IS30 family transposase